MPAGDETTCLMYNIILLGITLALFIMAIGRYTDWPVQIILVMMALIVVLDFYRVVQECNSVKRKVMKYKRFLTVEKKGVEMEKAFDAREETPRVKGKLTAEEDERVMRELEKIGKGKQDKRHLRAEYWKKLEEELGPKKSKMDELEAKKRGVEEMIELSKKKYNQRILDEQSFRDIVKDYQKRLIEIESEIRKLKPEKKEGEE